MRDVRPPLSVWLSSAEPWWVPSKASTTCQSPAAAAQRIGRRPDELGRLTEAPASSKTSTVSTWLDWQAAVRAARHDEEHQYLATSSENKSSRQDAVYHIASSLTWSLINGSSSWCIKLYQLKRQWYTWYDEAIYLFSVLASNKIVHLKKRSLLESTAFNISPISTKLRCFISYSFRYNSTSFQSRQFSFYLTCKCLWISSH